MLNKLKEVVLTIQDEIKAQEHNISEAFKMKQTKKRDAFIKRNNRELQRLNKTLVNNKK